MFEKVLLSKFTCFQYQDLCQAGKMVRPLDLSQDGTAEQWKFLTAKEPNGFETKAYWRLPAKSDLSRPTQHPLLLQIARLRQFLRFCDTRKLFSCSSCSSCCIEDLEFKKNIEERYEIEKTKLGEGGKVVGTPLCTRASNQILWPDRTRSSHVEIRKSGIWRCFCIGTFL